MAKMMEDLAKDYASRLKLAKVSEKEQEANKILAEIDNLVYVNTGSSITKEDKLALVEIVSGCLPMPPKKEAGKVQVVWDSDNSQYLRLIEYMMRCIQELKK